ncbi:Cytochrome c551 peroxidase [hydrothermal vent metagenome]|uniref:Cytochrome c551 peroxidase n=1 Tax=hydrothermal vent metagenome TaxID=652676 RepID=A0A3B0VDU9_9ZZZZ
MKWRTGAILTAILCFSFQPVMAGNSLRNEALQAFKPIPTVTPELKGNPVTPAKIELGKMLYFDPRLSKSDLISCNTCHNLGMGGADFQETSTGHGWRRGPRNAPTVFNSVFNVAQFWDGRAKNLAEQAKGPVQASVEMNNTPKNVLKTLNSMPGYRKLFRKAFPADKDPVTFDNMAKAIEAFEATLLTPDSPFDNFLRGDQGAMSTAAKKGLQIFMKKGCKYCHSGVNMGGEGYYPFGVVKAPAKTIMAGDKGRYKVTKNKGDKYVFKAPSLRNIALTAPYFHSGRVWSLREAVAIMGSAQLGATLTNNEINLIVDFLQATTGRQPQVEYPILPAPTDSTPHPVLK